MFKQSYSMASLLAATCFIAVGLEFVVAMQNETIPQRFLRCIPMTFFFALAAGLIYTRRPIRFALLMVLVIFVVMSALLIIMMLFLAVFGKHR
ncbi:MAG TPA: hypothetical protein VGJ04_08385 [Pirellulales bacterium]